MVDLRDHKEEFWLKFQDTGMSREIFNILYNSVIRSVEKREWQLSNEEICPTCKRSLDKFHGLDILVKGEREDVS